MKRLSVCLPAIVLALVLTLSGKTADSAVVAHSRDTRQIMYYWYSSPYDQFVDYNDLDDEMWEWEMWLGGISINQDPVGGTLLASGYFNNTYPHNDFPEVYIYAHYVY